MSTYNRGVNIFETIRKVTSRTEPFHSRFLADALTESLAGDRSLFEAVWKLTSPPKWNTPERPDILPEKSTGNGRIDICIHDKDNHRVLGIEVKTSESSAQSGQLERYLCDLRANDSEEEVMIAYLTPFNRKRVEEKLDLYRILPTVRKFEEFSKKFPDHHGGHVSWLDITDIPWDGNELWKQHQYYIRNKISSPTHLQASARKDRALDEFFGEKATSRFWETLADMGISPGDNGADINLAEFCKNLSSLTECLVSALEELICGGHNVSNRSCKPDQFPEDSRKPFLNPPYREIHEALFGLSNRFCHVWIEGAPDYGVRVAHKNHSNGVSLITSIGTDRFKTGQLR